VIPLPVGNNAGWNQKVDIRSLTDQTGTPTSERRRDYRFFRHGSQRAGMPTGMSAVPMGWGVADRPHAGGNTDLGEAPGLDDATTCADIVARAPDPAMTTSSPSGRVYVAMGRTRRPMAASRSASSICEWPISGERDVGDAVASDVAMRRGVLATDQPWFDPKSAIAR